MKGIEATPKQMQQLIRDTESHLCDFISGKPQEISGPEAEEMNLKIATLYDALLHFVGKEKDALGDYQIYVDHDNPLANPKTTELSVSLIDVLEDYDGEVLQGLAPDEKVLPRAIHFAKETTIHGEENPIEVEIEARRKFKDAHGRTDELRNTLLLYRCKSLTDYEPLRSKARMKALSTPATNPLADVLSPAGLEEYAKASAILNKILSSSTSPAPFTMAIKRSSDSKKRGR